MWTNKTLVAHEVRKLEGLQNTGSNESSINKL